MKIQRGHEMEAELRDPALTALLCDAYADDLALAPSPGRTERIMRQVMRHGVRPARRPFAWGALGWASGALAAAGVLLAIGLGMTSRMLQDGTQMAGNTPPISVPAPPKLTEEGPKPYVPSPTREIVPVVTERTPEPTPIPKQPKNRKPSGSSSSPEDTQPKTPTPDVTPDTPVTTSVAMVGAVAPESLYVEGKYDEAAEVWFARYQQGGNPDDLMANADALAMAPLPTEG